MPFVIPWLPVMGAALAYFVFGIVWYTFFKETWRHELHKRQEQLDPRDPTPYLIAGLGAVLNAIATAIVLQWILPTTQTSLLAVFITTLMLGGAVVAASAAKHYAFARWSWTLYAIDIGHDVCGYFLMSLILALLR